MLVQVIEVGPDTPQTVIWDTNKLRKAKTYEDEDGTFNLVDFANKLETVDNLTGYRCSASYNLFDLEHCQAFNKFDKEITLYCED